ncbi:hypothetical protein E4099_12405 [Streptomyces palmae]|uniref:Uncharacterized protein n=1 Tax=Streptomyces palmae TaxID=1701085 RepID=A0A4Z0H7X1_9ACTN|nr:hypothetical protein E4099_12405 [Streptomyces palmae]
MRAAERTAPASGRSEYPLAFVERNLPPTGADGYLAARKQGVRDLVLWADPYRQRLFAHIRTLSSAKGSTAVFEVLGEGASPLARITREPAMKGGRIRTRWTVEQLGRQPAVGRKGRPFWWGVWWLISPIQAAIAVGSLLAGSGDVARTPRRTRWRCGGRTELDWANGISRFELSVLTEGWDPRVTAALVALLTSHDSWLGHSWDTAAQ